MIVSKLGLAHSPETNCYDQHHPRVAVGRAPVEDQSPSEPAIREDKDSRDQKRYPIGPG